MPVFAPVQEDLAVRTTYYISNGERDAQLSQMTLNNASEHRMDYRTGLRITVSVNDVPISHFVSQI
jgi:hypothetical protein